jgi:hypothetical protein
MSDPFDELERQLRRIVRAAEHARPMRARRGWRRTGALVAVGALAVSGGAFAAVRLGSEHPDQQARKIGGAAVRGTAGLPACAPGAPSGPPVLSDSPTLREITALLPSMRTPAPAADQAQALQSAPPIGEKILRHSARTIALTPGVKLLVYVQQGIGIGEASDPVACAQARRQLAAKLDKDRSEAVKRATLRYLANLSDTSPRLQTLQIIAQLAGRSARPGVGLPVRPGHPLRPGIVLNAGAAGHRRLYVGIADPRTAQLTVSPTRPNTTIKLPTRITPRQGFYTLMLPTATGPVRLHETTADGQTLRVITIRGPR